MIQRINKKLEIALSAGEKTNLWFSRGNGGTDAAHVDELLVQLRTNPNGDFYIVGVHRAGRRLRPRIRQRHFAGILLPGPTLKHVSDTIFSIQDNEIYSVIVHVSLSLGQYVLPGHSIPPTIIRKGDPASPIVMDEKAGLGLLRLTS